MPATSIASRARSTRPGPTGRPAARSARANCATLAAKRPPSGVAGKSRAADSVMLFLFGRSLAPATGGCMADSGLVGWWFRMMYVGDVCGVVADGQDADLSEERAGRGAAALGGANG